MHKFTVPNGKINSLSIIPPLFLLGQLLVTPLPDFSPNIGNAKALLGLSRAESQYGFNRVGQTMARYRKMHKPGGTKNCVQERTQASAYVKQSPALVEKT
eukprot:2045077-Ditylum_brightwellii.AAC.1